MSKHRLTFDQYQALDAVNMSTLLALLQSPKHYQHGLADKEKETKAMRVGKASHTATLEPMQFLREYILEPAELPNAKGAMVLSDAKGYRNMTSYRDWCDAREADGKTVLSEAEYELAERIQEAVRAHSVASSLLRHGEREITIRWTDPETGIACKARIDWLSADIVDLKTTRHPTVFAFCRDAAQRNYHTRLAWYLDGVAHALGDPPGLPRAVFIIAAQNEPPFDVVVYNLPPDVIEAGRKRYRRLLETLAECRANDEWPGVAENEVIPLQLPPWELEQSSESLELTIGGERVAL